MGLVGKLNGDIGGLTQLRSLDLSLNRGLTGSLSSWVGELQNLNILILSECSFSGNIPDELGSLASLTFLALNSNYFTGRIHRFWVGFKNLYWLDLANNQFTGSLPISTFITPGLDLLLTATCFNFNENQLSGPIPISIFSSDYGTEKSTICWKSTDWQYPIHLRTCSDS
ncbi:hypothetical protein L1049_027928 [Liquidambar formosana]|uniref:Uncharacterized protein n=1 Tax=Liquidambar formosana TaxID=63359 RepID=A0AAP0WVX2_LIQFO